MCLASSLKMTSSSYLVLRQIYPSISANVPKKYINVELNIMITTCGHDKYHNYYILTDQQMIQL